MRIGIIGAGRVGASFVFALPGQVVGITGSTAQKTKAQADQYGVTPYIHGEELLLACDVVLLLVRDDALQPVSQSLADKLAHRKDVVFSTHTVLHGSGAADVSVLQPLAALGIHTGSLHPLQSFPAPSATALQHIYMAVDGDDTAISQAKNIASMLHSQSFYVPADERALYHGAACFCSNYVVTAVAAAQALMSRWTDTPEDAGKALLPLFMGTAGNIQSQSFVRNALTGPIARGDIGTVQKHLACMPQPFHDAYTAFGILTAQMALSNQTITTNQYQQLIHILAVAEGEKHEQKSNNPDD